MDVKAQYRIVLIYILLGTLWIFFSDMLVEFLFKEKDQLLLAQNIKGWFYIGFTGLLLFVLIRKDMNKVSMMNSRLVKSYDHTINGWVHVMDLRHKETTDHTKRVTLMTLELVKQFGIESPKELKYIERGAILHDIGKIGINDAVILKPGKLTDEEWGIIKTHPKVAYDLMHKTEFLKPSIDIPYCHHEKWDGTGYPRGLKGDEIPLTARIFAVVDVWDALSHKRVYKESWPEEKVLNYIEEESGKHFDPKVVEVFLKNYSKIKAQLS